MRGINPPTTTSLSKRRVRRSVAWREAVAHGTTCLFALLGLGAAYVYYLVAETGTLGGAGGVHSHLSTTDLLYSQCFLDWTHVPVVFSGFGTLLGLVCVLVLRLQWDIVGESSRMYSFVRGARLFVKGTREGDDADDVPDPGDQLAPEEAQALYQTRTHMASASQESREVFRSSHVRSGLRTVHTSRVIRKTTTMTRGEHKTNVSQSSSTHTAVQGTQTRALSRRTAGTSTDREVHSTGKEKRVVRKTTLETRKKQKISDIITGQTDESLSAREALLRWAQRTTERYPGVKVSDFTSSWRDGLAFNAIIHRNRPDVIDFRSLRTRAARENLETAFHVAEYEFGVTRLLDPEDVDTPEPDEKSLITYISSLYDVFPEPPSHHPLADDERFRKVEEYREIASSLHLWMREATSRLIDRNFPSTLIEMKALLAENSRFRVEDVPPRLHEKQRLSHLYREIQKIFREYGSIDIEIELQYENIERSWNRLMQIHQERDQALQDEIARLEKLQRLAEKIHREAKQCDSKLDDIEKRIAEEEKRVQRLHVMDAQHNCDQIESELKHAEESIKSMSKDVQTLRDGRYHQAPELHRRVQHLHQRWVNIRLDFQTKVLSPLSSRTFKTEERKIIKQRYVVTEQRLVETNEAFKFLQECIEWVTKKLKSLEDAEFGSDLPSVQSLLEQYQTEHRLIDQFQKNVDQCISRKHQFKGDEHELYVKLLNRLEKGYSELLVMSNKRLSDLETLLDFIQSATAELIWLNEKEETETTRDWSAKNLKIVEVEQYHETMINELEKREEQFNVVQDRGESLVKQHHPASKCIEAYMAAMQTQWAWILQLMLCLETHLKYASAYHQFFTEARECEQWINRVEDKLNTTFSKQTFSIDEGERLLKEMQELRDNLTNYGNIVVALIDRSKEIVPLKQRRQPLPRPLRVTAICTYKQLNMSVAKDEQCWLHDNSQKIKWKIISSNGTEGMVPGAIFLIPPPNPEAIELAESLKRKYDLLVTTWTKKQHKLRQNMVFATLKVVKSWDFRQYASMDRNQRDAILKALQEDIQKLVSEGDQNDPALKRLQEEMKACLKRFAEFEKRLREEEAEKSPRNPVRRFNDMAPSLQNALNEKDKILSIRIQAPVPRDRDSLERLVVQHKEFETELEALQPQITELKTVYSAITKKTPTLQSKHDAVIEVWDRVWATSNVYVEKLKAVEIAIQGLEEAIQVVSGIELKLASYDNLPSDLDALHNVHDGLIALQCEMQQQQPVIDQLGDSVLNVVHITERFRPKVHTADTVRLEEDSRKVTRRWENACSQVVERLRSCDGATELVRAYKNKADYEERPWLAQISRQVTNLKPIKGMSPKEAANEYEEVKMLYDELADRKPSVENTNVLGGRYVREAKIYDLRLKHYKDGLEEVHPSLDASVAKKAKLVAGADLVSQELDSLNKQYSDTVDTVIKRLHDLEHVTSKQKEQQFVSQALPLTLKTYRTELALDRASPEEPMDVDGHALFSEVIYHTETQTSKSYTVDKESPDYDMDTKISSSTVMLSMPGKGTSSSSKPVHATRLQFESSGINGEGDVRGTCVGSSMTFTELRSTKRLERKHEATSTEDITCTRGIVNPESGERVTLSEAIEQGILVEKTGHFADPTTGKNISLEDALNRGYIEGEFLDRITQTCGIADPKTGIEVTLMEAIQRHLYDPQKGTFLDPKKGTPITIEEAEELGIIQKQKTNQLIQLKIIRITKLTIIEAVRKKLLDPVTGKFKDPKTSQLISLPDAFRAGYLDSQSSVCHEGGIPLAEAIDRGLVDEKSGQIVDQYSGERYTVDEAITQEIVLGDIKEVVDTSTGDIVTVKEALSMGILVPKNGRYINKKSKESLTLKQARLKQYIVHPFTLKDICDLKLLDDQGKIIHPINKSKITLLEAIAKGILDTEVKCIIHPETQELLTLPEALEREVLTADGMFVDSTTGEVLTLIQAVNKGLITSVCHKMIFDIEGVKDSASGEYISFNAAVDKGIVDLNNGKFIDSKSKKVMTFEEANEEHLIQPQIYEMLMKKIGIKDAKKRELTLLESVMMGFLDSKTGQVREPKTKHALPLREAVQRDIITEEGASLLRSLLNITVAMATVTKTVTKYVTVTSDGVATETKITFQEAMRRGLIDETKGTFTEPVTGNVIPLEEAINMGILGLTSEWPSLPHEKETPQQFAPKVPVGYSPPKDASPTRTTKYSRISEDFASSSVSSISTEYSSTQSTVKQITTDYRISEKTDKLPSPTKKDIPKSVSEVQPTEQERPKSSLKKEKPKTLPVREAYHGPGQQIKTPPTKEEKAPQSPTKQTRLPSPVKKETSSPTKEKALPVEQVKPLPEKTHRQPSSIKDDKAPSPGMKEKPEVTDKENKPLSPTKDKKQVPTMEEKLPISPVKERLPSPTKKERSPSPTKKEKSLSPSKDVPSPTKKERSPSPSSKDVPSPTKKERSPSPSSKDVPSPTKKERSPSPSSKDVPSPTTKERSPSPSSKDVPSPTKKERSPSPSSKDVPSPTKKERSPSPSSKDVPSPTKKERSPSPSSKDVPSPTKKERSPSPSSKDVPSPTKKERSPSPTKDESLIHPKNEKKPSPTKKDKSPSPVKEDRSPSPSRKEKISSPTKKDKSTTPSKEDRSPSPSRKDEIPSRAKKDRSPSPTKKERSPSPSRKEKVPSPVKKDRSPSPTKEDRPLSPSRKEKLPSPTKKDKSPSSTKKDQAPSPSKEDKLPSSPKKEDRPFSPSKKDRSPSPTKKDKSPSPTKIEEIHVVKSEESESQRSVFTNGTDLNGEQVEITTVTTKETQILELPPDGWYLKEAIDKKLFDAETGLFTIPGTDRLVSFEETIKLELINPSSATVIDTSTKRPISLVRALEKGILDSTGHYCDSKRKLKITMKEAIKRKLVILVERTEVVHSGEIRSTKVIQITQEEPQIKLGTADTLESKKVTTEEYYVIKPSIEFHPKTGKVVDTSQGKQTDLMDAVKSGAVDSKMFAVKDTSTGDQLPLDEAIKKGLIDKKTGKITDKKSGKSISVTDALKLGLLAVVGAPVLATTHLVETIRETFTPGVTTTEQATSGITSVKTSVETHKVAQEVTREPTKYFEVIQIHPDGEKTSPAIEIEKEYIVYAVDSETGKEIPLQEAAEKGIIDSESMKQLKEGVCVPENVVRKLVSLTVQNPVTGESISLTEAVDTGLLDRDTAQKVVEMVPSDLATSLSPQVEMPAEQIKVNDIGKTKPESPTKLDVERSKEGSPTRPQRTPVPEPRFEVTLGRAKSLLSPEREAVVLQKIRRKVIPPKDAAKAGIIDEKTANTLDDANTLKGPDGKPTPLEEAVRLKLVDGNSGAITEPKHGDKLTIKEALDVGLLDSSTGNVLLPIGRSLSLPEVVTQGLVEPEAQQIIHPETGDLLALDEAVLCEIVDESSTLIEPVTKNEVTLDEAMKTGLVNSKTAEVSLPSGKEPLINAVQSQQLVEPLTTRGDIVPMLALTFPVAVQHGLVDVGKRLYRHPSTNEEMPIEEAVDRGFILALPFPATEECVSLTEAVDKNLINPSDNTFTNPGTGDIMPLASAIEQGLLQIKPFSSDDYLFGLQAESCVSSSMTTTTIETVVTTKVSDGMAFTETTSTVTHVTTPLSVTDAIQSGLVDLSSGTFTDTNTGKTIPISEAVASNLLVTKEQPLPEDTAKYTLTQAFDVLYDENKQKFHHPKTNKLVTLDELVKQGVIDMDAVICDTDSGKQMTTKQAIAEGKINVKTGTVEAKSKRKISIKDAAKTGLLVVVGAPVIAGIAAGKAVKSLISRDKPDKPTVTKQPSPPSKPRTLSPQKETSPKEDKKPSKSPSPTKEKPGKSPIEQRPASPKKSTPPSPVKEVVKEKVATITTQVKEVTLLTSAKKPMEIADSSDKLLTIGRAVDSGVIDYNNCYITLLTGERLPVTDALQRQLATLETEIEIHSRTEIKVTEKASQQNAIRMAIEEKYRTCEHNMDKLLSWLAEVEIRISGLGVVQERVDELHQQIMKATDIKHDLDDHQRLVNSSVEQVYHIVKEGHDVLSKDEVQKLQKESDTLKKRYNNTCDQSDKLIRRLSACLDELQKFRNEMSAFKEWLDKAQRTLVEKERNLRDLGRLKEQADSYKEFTSDVIAHQADLRFITMAAQKFLDESKDYLKVLNDFRTALPQRLSHVEPSDFEVKAEVAEVTSRYQTLLDRAHHLNDRLSSLADKQHQYVEAVKKASRWLSEVQKNAKKLLDEPVAAEPKAIQEQLDRIKSLSMDVVSQGLLIENAKYAAKSLLEGLEDVDISPSERHAIEDAVTSLENDYTSLNNSISVKSNELQVALVHSQDIQDGLDRLLRWMDECESTIRNQSKPVSLIREKLDEQIQEHKVLQSDIKDQQPSIEALKASAQDLLNSTNQRLVKKIEFKLKDFNTRFDKLKEKTQKRGELLEEVSTSLHTFQSAVTPLEEWMTQLSESIESRDVTRLDADEYASRIEECMNQRNSKKDDFEEVVKLGKNLVSKRDVTDTTPTKDKVKALEQQWKELGDVLQEKQRQGKARAEQLSAYEALRVKVLEWLSNMEIRVERLETVAVDRETLRKQSMEIKPLIKEHADYAPTIDKVNDLGHAYDALLRGERGESPRRKVTSPTKKAGVPHTPTSPTRKSPSSEYSEILRGSSERGLSPTKTTVSAQSPLSSASSGFSSRRSSTDNLGLEDTSIVQHQLSEINHRYSLIGMKLCDRQQEVDVLLEEVKGYLESLKALATFLQNKERSLPKESLPSTKEQAEKQLQTMKTLQEEMQEKQSEMDHLRNQTNDLLKRKPSSEGSANLQQQVAELASKWAELSNNIKERLAFLQDLKDFQDTNDLLTNWLNQKDKMFQVLGPIASEPRMVTAQMQQVQVMREEFTTQKPVLDRLDNLGASILSHLDSTSSGAKRIRDQTSAIHQHWNNLEGQLAQREKSLDAASGATTEFHNRLNRLQDSLQHISDEFDRITEAGTDTDDQLRKLDSLEEQLESQRPLLADAESVCENLCDILSDSASKNEIKNKLNSLEKQYSNLNRKINHRRAELESSLKEDRELFISCDNIQTWLKEMQDTLSREMLISAIQDVLASQVQQFEPIYKEVSDKEHEVHILLSRGNDMQNKMSRKHEAQQLKTKLDMIKRQWEKIRKDATARHTRLQGCLDNCKRYHVAVSKFVPWLEISEDKLSSLKPISFKRADLEKQLKEIQSFKNDLSRHSQEYDNLRNLADTLISCCDTDKESVRSEITSISKRWDLLNHGVLQRLQCLEDISSRLMEYQDSVRDLQHSLQRLEDKLASHDALGDAGRDPKLFERMKSLVVEASDMQKQLDHVKSFAKSLTRDAGSGSDTAHISDEVESLESRHQQLLQNLEDRCAILESASKVVSQFNAKVRSLHHELNVLEETLNKMSPVAREIKVVNVQIVEMKNFHVTVAKVKDELEEVEQQCKEIISHGYTPDPKGCKEQITNLTKQLSRVEEQCKVRHNSLENILTRLENFYEELQEVSHDLDEASREERLFKPVGGDVETVRMQQAEFKAFVRDHVEPLGRAIEEVNNVGQGLIQSAAPGVSTGGLEHDLDKLKDKWNDLKEKLSDRERRLDVALLQSGKFQEALDGVQKWLQDTEEMVGNQKPPSSDYKVVKAQLQEQKFLKKLLLDRQNSMSSLHGMATDVVCNLKPSEREAVETQVNDLLQRFDELMTSAKNRMDALEATLPVARDFQERMAPLVEWLEQTEKQVAAMATIPTDQEKIGLRIEEHQELHEDILDHKGSFEELTELAQNLMSLVGDDEAQVVVERLQEVTDRYAKLVEDSEHIGQLLAEAHEGLGSFVLNFEDLLAWIMEMESRLDRFQVLSVYVDKLQEQLDELTELTEETADHQKQVADVVGSGQDIMKHASGDDAVQVKEKLDFLQVKYTELTHRASDRLRQVQEALPIAQNFHSSYDRLTIWMDEAEKVLKNMELLSLNVQEKTIQQLEVQIQEYRIILETVNHLGPQLCQISPGEGAATIENLVSRVTRRFDAICEKVQRKGERIELSKQRNVEIFGDIDELLDWFHDAERQVLEAEPLIPDPDVLSALLREQKALNEEVSSQKGRVRDILAAAKKLMRESSTDDLAAIRDKSEELKEATNGVVALCADRLNALEQALPLAEHFFETHADLVQWLDEAEAEAALVGTTGLNAIQIKKQQDKTKALLQSVNEHKPLVDKLNKTGSTLLKLCSEEEGSKVKDILDSDNGRYSALRNALRERQNALEEALQATSQFSDKLDGMLNALSSTADQLSNAEPISAHPERIQEQIQDNKALMEDLDKRSTALEAVKRAAKDVITKAGGAEENAVRDIKQKLERLNGLWDTIQKSARNRGRSLEDALSAAEHFWDELNAVMKALKDLQDSLNAQEPPAVEPSAIQQQQEVLQEIRQEIDQTKPEVDQCRQAGQNLMQLCGEPDKPEVKKHMEDLDSAWENVTTLYAKREQNLVDAMEKAMCFHDTLQNLLEFLDTAEEKFVELGAVGSDIDDVKGQIGQLKDFKTEVDPHMVEVESLNRQAQELMERTSQDQATSIREPLSEINRRWDDLLKGIVDRQRELENALLKLGQFQHALDELLVWISRTEKTLDDLKPIFGDPQVIEVELAKHKVLVNDIQAHETSVNTLNRVGRQLIESDRGSEDANVTSAKLNNLNSKWQNLQSRAADRQAELEEALKEAQAFTQEIQDLLMWLSDIDGQLVTSKPVGGLPETAREQLNRFMELYNELDNNRHKVESVLQHGQEHLKRSTEGASTGLQHNLKTLKQRWDNVLNRANDRKIKLEIALREATEFHEALQEFVDWLTKAERYLTGLQPVSRVMDIVLQQIEEHKAFQKDVGAHREVMLNLDKKGTHLKYFSQKQDVILIKNLLISVQHRWERVVSKAAERTRALDHGYKESKEFHDSWTDLTSWLEDAEHTLDDAQHIGNDPEKIKQLLAKHKEFQRTLGSKQSVYDSTMKTGRALKEKCPKADVPVLQNMMDDLKNKWNSVCAKSVDRQRKLEEALLFSGQFKEAVEALIDWLDKAKASLALDQPLHGDLDTVTALFDQHKSFQEDLENRAKNLESVRKTANDLLLTATPDDAEHIRSQTAQLDSKWEEVVLLSSQKQILLEEALKQAEQLHKAVHMLLEWLSDAEMKLRFAGPLPEDEETTRKQIEEHRLLMQEMAEQEINKDTTITLAQQILQKCHPDAVSVIRHWITIIQSRWEEVSVWAKQREQRLLDHLRSLRDITDLLEELLAWLIGAEASLTALEAEPLPDDIPSLEQLIKDHQGFMDDMCKRQPDVERVTKAFQSKRQPHQPGQTTQREKGSRDRHDGSHDRRTGRPAGAAGPRTSTPVRHHVEPEIKNPRARELVDKWRNVWLLAMERQRRLQDKYNYLLELEKIKHFDFDEWRRRFLGWLNNKKSRVMDLFRKIDRDNDGKVTREDFIEGILKSKFPTSRLEMERVAEIFDRNGDGYVDHKEYLETLRPDRERPLTEAEKIQDEVQRLVAKCTCVHRFKVYQVGEGKYRFGDSQKLRLVRILRSTVMVRVGGGWVALDEFLVKNDPCRAKGRTNLELREQFILAEGVSQSLSPFKPKPSPNSSVSSQSGTSSFARSGGSIPATGPITKVREKSERSVPMRPWRSPGVADSNSDISGPSYSETDSFSAKSRTRATPSRLTPGAPGSRPSSRSTSRAGSRPSSRPPSRQSSRPTSRAGSDLSVESVDGYKARKAGAAATPRQRTPSSSQPTTPVPRGTPGSSSRIPTVKKTSGTTNKDTGIIKGREPWK